MRHLKLIGLAVLAAFAATALLAVAATGASAAEPEWGHCVPAKKGFYEDSNCTKRDEKKGKPKGKYEWDASAAAACYEKKGGLYKNSACTEEDVKKGVPKGKYEKTGGAKFESSGGAGVLVAATYICSRKPHGEGFAYEPGSRVPHAECLNEQFGFGMANVAEVECESEHASGEAVSDDEVANVSVRFKGCTFLEAPSTTKGLPAGEIQVNPLKGRLGYIDKATHEVGVLLEPAVAGNQFAEFENLEGGQIIHVGEGNPTEGAFYEEAHGAPTGNDGIISPITPVNQMTHTFTQDYRTETVIPYEPPSCPISHTCPRGAKGVFNPTQDLSNVPSHFEGGRLEALEMWLVAPHDQLGEETSAWSPAGEEVTNVNTVEGEAEIKG